MNYLSCLDVMLNRKMDGLQINEFLFPRDDRMNDG